MYKLDKLLWKQKKLPVLRNIQYGPLLFFNSILYLQPLRWNSLLQYDRDIRLLIKFLTVYTCITFHFFALALGKKGVFYSDKKISMLHFCTWKKKLNWPSLPRSRIYIVVLLYKSLSRWSQFLFLKHIFIFSFLF